MNDRLEELRLLELRRWVNRVDPHDDSDEEAYQQDLLDLITAEQNRRAVLSVDGYRYEFTKDKPITCCLDCPCYVPAEGLDDDGLFFDGQLCGIDMAEIENVTEIPDKCKMNRQSAPEDAYNIKNEIEKVLVLMATDGYKLQRINQIMSGTDRKQKELAQKMAGY